MHCHTVGPPVIWPQGVWILTGVIKHSRSSQTCKAWSPYPKKASPKWADLGWKGRKGIRTLEQPWKPWCAQVPRGAGAGWVIDCDPHQLREQKSLSLFSQKNKIISGASDTTDLLLYTPGLGLVQYYTTLYVIMGFQWDELYGTLWLALHVWLHTTGGYEQY